MKKVMLIGYGAMAQAVIERSPMLFCASSQSLFL
ncbi:hypothetical protein, partial [Klebsiella oxytoca]